MFLNEGIDPSIFCNKNYIDILSTEALIRTRGGTSSHYPKQQYRLKLRYDGKANNLSLLGMDADEDWILDALYADYSKIRNKLSFEIWNDMYDCSEKKESTKQHARYVDVYINQEYVGLYMLKEFIDWKKLGLDKNNENGSGVLIKGMAYATVGWDGYELTKHTGMVFPFYIKYPKEQENYSKYWEAIMPKIHTNFYDKKNITEEYLLENFEIENYIDYKLLMNFICANDNFGVKNVYASIKNLNEDTKVVLTPWDLDMTYGYSWGGKTGLYENSDNLKKIDNMWIDSDYINNLIKERYKEVCGLEGQIPEDGYHGKEIIKIAEEIYKNYKDLNCSNEPNLLKFNLVHFFSFKKCPFRGTKVNRFCGTHNIYK